MDRLKLTADQVAALRAIALRRGMRLLISHWQVGIGESGVPAFSVVYSHLARRPWALRNESDRELKNEMKAVLA